MVVGRSQDETEKESDNITDLLTGCIQGEPVAGVADLLQPAPVQDPVCPGGGGQGQSGQAVQALWCQVSYCCS